jgi:hypothetical protein
VHAPSSRMLGACKSRLMERRGRIKSTSRGGRPVCRPSEPDELTCLAIDAACRPRCESTENS